MTFDISSPANDRIKRLVRLRERRHRDTEKVFVVEGPREISRAIESGRRPREIYGTAASIRLIEADLRFSCATDPLEKASYRSDPDALIAVFDQSEQTLESLGVGGDALILMVEGLEKPGNLGAILRIADSFGADAVLAVDSRVDPFNPNVVRASTGAIFTVSLVIATIDDSVRWLRDHEIKLVATSPSSGSHPWAVDLTGPTALLVGSEDQGLSTAALAAANQTIRIPMTGTVDSLNTSVSMAIIAYETIRQRRS
jgi:TrmH family RNA methyltransferase